MGGRRFGYRGGIIGATVPNRYPAHPTVNSSNAQTTKVAVLLSGFLSFFLELGDSLERFFCIVRVGGFFDGVGIVD